MYLYKVEMADRDIHLLQAMHNEEVANMLIEKNPYHDWGITAAFYALIHYFEYWLFNQPEEHTETSIPVDKNGKLRYTPHAWREKLIEKKLSKDAFKSFRKLRDASETARYLSLARIQPGVSMKWIPKPAPQYFNPNDAKNLVEKALETFKKEIGIKAFPS